MNFLKNFKPEAQAALSHLLLRVLCILIIERTCAQLVQQSSGTPAVLINYVIIGIYAVGFVLAAAKINMGYKFKYIIKIN